MATSTLPNARAGWFRGKRQEQRPPLRVLTAAATRLDLTDRKQARRSRALRQGWQLDSWMYRDSIGELRYALNFLANCTARMRIFPAAYAQGAESDEPVPLADSGAPEQFVDLCNHAMAELGNGKLALSSLLKSLSTNISVAAECTLLGREDPATGNQSWTVRSIDEIIVYDDKYMLREVPNDPQGILGWEELDPDLTVASRMWTPHPRYHILADGPVRALIDDLEALLILRRMIRATGRSRLAGAGVLLVPNEMSIVEADEDDREPESDPFMAKLIQSMIEPISDEGVASAVVPIVMRGPGEQLQHVRLLSMATQFSAEDSKVREELVGIIATGLDLPKEIIQGVADLNHWTAWQVDDNTFRHHVEPHVIECVDCLTGAYLRPYIKAMAPAWGLSPVEVEQWTERILFWYDPTELVTHPDQTADALQLHDRLVLSDEKLREIAGFSDADGPDVAELERRLISKQRNWPPNLTMAILHDNDPSLVVAPITESGVIPGIKPSGVDTGDEQIAARAAAQAAPKAEAAPQLGPGAPAKPPSPAPPAVPGPPALTAAAVHQKTVDRLSRQLTALDVDLRARLHTACNLAIQRQLEKAGGRLRSKVAKDEALRAKILHSRNEHVAMMLGHSVVTAAGLTPGDLTPSEWENLREQFYSWTGSAQARAIAIARTLAGLGEDDAAVREIEHAMATNLDAAWDMLKNSMTAIAQNAMYDPALETTGFDNLVPTGVVRAACSVAGGYAQQDLGTLTTLAGLEVPAVPAGVPVGQIGTSEDIQALATSTDLAVESRTWIHGPSLNPFEPHLELDGVEFTSWDDAVLTNGDSFPNNDYFIPGDHIGCMCDWTVNYASDGGTTTGEDTTGGDVTE